MPKNKGKVSPPVTKATPPFSRNTYLLCDLQGGKNRRRGKNENDNEKRELTFKEEGQGTF